MTGEGNDPAGPPALHDPRPVVRMPASGVSGGAIAAAGVAAALVLFVAIGGGGGRTTAPVAPSQANAFRDPPPLAVPPEPPVPVVTVAAPPAVVPQPLVPLVVPPPVTYLPPRQTVPSPPVILPIVPALPLPAPSPRVAQAGAGDAAPALVVDTGPDDGGAPIVGQDVATQRGGQPTRGITSPDETPVRATFLRNRTDIMPVGTLIPAVLETPIDTARPGLVRAVVSRDTRGFDGRRVLVPRGSRLIGEYQSDVRGGQNRVLVTWTRLVRPDGVTIRIASPAADALGGAGVPGRVNTFFFERFASAVLQSALNVGVNLASRPARGSVIVGLPTGAIGNVGQTLLPTNDLRPKITVRSGAVINVFVARDLDFTGTGSKP